MLHTRARYKLSAVPLLVVSLCVLAFGVVLALPAAKGLLASQVSFLPWLVIGVSAAVPLAFAVWYLASYAEIRRGRMRVRSLMSSRHINLRELAKVEVCGSPTASKRMQHQLTLLLEDEQGRQLLLPLNTWRDEDLLMARILRATVERRVVIGGDPILVKRFTGLLGTYRSWDRQQAAA